MIRLTAYRYHDISFGHRVHGHENKCSGLHGHNYRVHFYAAAPKLDSLGRVIDFSVLKSKLCMWLEDNWDHKFLLWNKDPLLDVLRGVPRLDGTISEAVDAIVAVPFNPTAENIADHLLRVIGPQQLSNSEVALYRVGVDETRKCSAVAEVL